MNNNTNLNIHITSYFINILASPDVSTCFTTGGTTTKTIKHPVPTKHHQNKVERMWHMGCKEMELQYRGKSITKHFGQPYLFLNLDELNIIADTM